MNIYVASSWRNTRQPVVVGALRDLGHEVYDFRNPPGGTGFSWKDVDPEPRPTPATPDYYELPEKGTDLVPVARYLQMVDHPAAVAGFDSDFDAMQRCDLLVMVLPCGKSAHLELGWAAGAEKPTLVLLEDPVEPELMYRCATWIAPDLRKALDIVEDLEEVTRHDRAPF